MIFEGIPPERCENLLEMEQVLCNDLERAWQETAYLLKKGLSRVALMNVVSAIDLIKDLDRSLRGQTVDNRNSGKRYKDLLRSTIPCPDKKIPVQSRDYPGKIINLDYPDIIYAVRCRSDHRLDTLDIQDSRRDYHVRLEWNSYNRQMLHVVDDYVVVEAFMIIERCLDAICEAFDRIRDYQDGPKFKRGEISRIGGPYLIPTMTDLSMNKCFFYNQGKWKTEQLEYKVQTHVVAEWIDLL